jgi:hypothetical protein
MALYLVSYDIAEKDKAEYEDLWAKLKEIKATKILYSEWLVVKDHQSPGNTAKDIFNLLSPLIRKDDRLLVQELGGYAAWDKLLISEEKFKELVNNARF